MISEINREKIVHPVGPYYLKNSRFVQDTCARYTYWRYTSLSAMKDIAMYEIPTIYPWEIWYLMLRFKCKWPPLVSVWRLKSAFMI